MGKRNENDRVIYKKNYNGNRIYIHKNGWVTSSKDPFYRITKEECDKSGGVWVHEYVNSHGYLVDGYCRKRVR